MNMKNIMTTNTSYYIFIISFLVFISLFLFEEKGDERIESHKNITDRIALFLVLISLGVCLVYNYAYHMINFQILYVFVLSILVKFFLRLYFYFRK